jgi:hypothetical protein
MQLGAGVTWNIVTAYQWKGLKGNWEGFGPDIKPQVQSQAARLPLTVSWLSTFTLCNALKAGLAAKQG